MSRGYNKSETAMSAGVSIYTLLRHIRLGLGCPDADMQIGVYRAYSEAARDAVVAYFASRKKWQRINVGKNMESE